MKRSTLFIAFIIISTILTLFCIKTCASADSGLMGFVKKRYIDRISDAQIDKDILDKKMLRDSIRNLRLNEDSTQNIINLDDQKEELLTVINELNFTNKKSKTELIQIVNNIDLSEKGSLKKIVKHIDSSKDSEDRTIQMMTVVMKEIKLAEKGSLQKITKLMEVAAQIQK